MGDLVETGLGWYLDEDYLLTVGNQQLCTIATGGGGGGGGAPLSPNTQYTDTNLSRTNVFQIGDANPVWIEISNVTSRVYWMYIEMGSYYSGDTIWAVAAVSKEPFSISMAGWPDNPYSATKPPSSPAQRYIETLTGFSSWTDVYGIVIGLHGTAYSGGYWFAPNSWSGDIPKLFHESVSGTTVIDTGLGWYADPMYLMWNAGVTAKGQEVPQPERIYHKAYDGVCVAAYINGDPYKGPIIVSTVEQNAKGYTEPSWLTPEIGGTFTYLGLTWYYYGAYWVVKSAVSSTPLPVINYDWATVADAAKEALEAAAVTTSPAGTTKTATKVQGGAGAFAVASYPHNGNTVHVAVGISSIGNPNSAATVALDGVNGSYNTFNREGMQFTMYYTSQETGTLTADVPVVTLDTDISALPGLYEARLFLAVADAAQVHVGYVPADEDPYAGGGTSAPSGGTPDFTEVSESISPGSTFPISFQSTGLCRVYVPSITDLNDLANYLWTDQTFLDTIKNILINQFENFMEAVISLTMVPCPVPTGTAQPVKVMFLPTGLSFPPATQQFVEVDCGYVDITERYASALDYNPYTKVSLYLPFIGTVPLDTDEVMGHRVKCVYTIDIVSGACVAKIMVDYPDSSNGVLYQFSGHCSISMPLTAADFSSYYAAAMSGLKMAAGLAAAGAGAPGLAGTLLGEPTAHPSSTTTTTRTTERNAATGRQILTGTESRETSHTPGQASFKELATRASVNTVGAVINSKFSVEHSGGFTGNTGFLGVQAPYVIITRPDMCNPDEYGVYNGRPSMMYLYLGNLSGFTQVQNIKLTGIPATNPELGEIAELLKTGVIL